MKKRNITLIFSSLIIAAFAITMTGCAAREYRTDGSPVSTAPAEVVSTQPSVEESSEEPSEEESSEEPSEEESSEEESSEEESSEEESSEEESSEEESSEEESSEEERSEEESSEEERCEEESSEEESSEEEAEGIKITFVKPEAWSDNVHVAVYEKGGIAELPGEAMTNNGDGTFSYTITEEIENPVAIFNDADDVRQRNMYPRSGALDVEDGGNYDPTVG